MARGKGNHQWRQAFLKILISLAFLLESTIFLAQKTSEEYSEALQAPAPAAGSEHAVSQEEIAREFSTFFNTESSSMINVSNPFVSDDHIRTKRSLSGRDKRIKKYKEEFKKYEKCMTEKERMKKKFFEGFIEARIAMDGQTVMLSCLVCPRLDINIEQYGIKWRRRILSSEKEKVVKTDKKHFILMPDKALLIRGITLEDGGMYFCYQRKGHAASYMVDVLRGEKYQTVFNPPDKGHRPAKTKNLAKNNIKLKTQWSEWSKCNQCSKRGQRRKIGFCTVRKLNRGKPLGPEDSPWLDQFKEGLPCRSSLLPASVRRLREVRQRSSEVLMSYCFTPCPTLPALKTYTDANGNVIEVVKANKGFVSMKEGVPKLPKLVKRKMIYEKLGRRIKLDCPHGKQDVSVRWQNGSQTMNALTIRRQTRGRVWIDPLHNLRIRKLQFHDTASYSCWTDGTHIATIKIRVVTTTRRSYKDYILLSGFLGVILILCCVGCAVCRAQRKKTLK